MKTLLWKLQEKQLSLYSEAYLEHRKAYKMELF